MKDKATPKQMAARILRKIHGIKPFVEASLNITRKKCGNPRCRCAREGPIHQTALLTWKEGQTTHTLYVPVGQREEVAQWVEEGKKLKRLIKQMSQAQRELLTDRRKNKKR